MNIVVVEDVPMIRERIVDALLELQGVCVVGEADSVETALRKIEASRPDVVLLDISLPSNMSITNGIGVLKWVKQMYPTMHVVMLTNHAGKAYSDACNHAGAFTLLDKSNDFEELPAVMAELSRPQKPLRPIGLPPQKQKTDPASHGSHPGPSNQPKQDIKFTNLWLSLLVGVCRLVAHASQNGAWKGNTWRSN